MFLKGITFFVVSCLAISSAEYPILDGQELVNAIFKSPSLKYTHPPGIYRVKPPSQWWHMYIKCSPLRPTFEIDFTEVTLLFTNASVGGIMFDRCDKLKFHGATIAWDPLPFTQGVVTAVNQAARTITFKISPGYSSKGLTEMANPFAGIFDPSRHVKVNQADLSWGNKINAVAGTKDTFNLVWPVGQNVHNTQPNDLIVVRQMGKHAIYMDKTGNSQFSNITINSSPCMGILEVDSLASNTYREITIKPGNPPGPGAPLPLISTNADGLHSVNSPNGPVIKENYFEATGDDAIAVHGRFSTIVDINPSTKTLRVVEKDAGYMGNRFETGDSIIIYDTKFNIIGYSTVVSATAQTTWKSTKTSVLFPLLNPLNSPERSYTDIVLASWNFSTSQPTFDCFASNPSKSGANSVITKNKILSHRARGIMYKGSQGLIADNYIEGSSYGGIVLWPEFTWFIEADFSRNVTIRDNVIKDVAYGAEAMGGIMVAASVCGDKGCSFGTGRSHYDIRIVNNHLENVPFTNIVISSANYVTISQNEFVGAQCGPRPYNHQGFPIGDKNKIIWASYTENLSVCGNKFDKNGLNCGSTEYTGDSLGLTGAKLQPC